MGGGGGWGDAAEEARTFPWDSRPLGRRGVCSAWRGPGRHQLMRSVVRILPPARSCRDSSPLIASAPTTPCCLGGGVGGGRSDAASGRPGRHDPKRDRWASCRVFARDLEVSSEDDVPILLWVGERCVVRDDLHRHGILKSEISSILHTTKTLTGMSRFPSGVV